jgi:hypothetical protein
MLLVLVCGPPLEDHHSQGGLAWWTKDRLGRTKQMLEMIAQINRIC